MTTNELDVVFDLSSIRTIKIFFTDKEFGLLIKKYFSTLHVRSIAYLYEYQSNKLDELVEFEERLANIYSCDLTRAREIPSKRRERST